MAKQFPVQSFLLLLFHIISHYYEAQTESIHQFCCSQDGRITKINFFFEKTTSGTYLEGVSKEVMVEHGPVLAANVNNDFAEFITDEIRSRFVLSQQEFGQTAADFHLVL